MRRFDPEYLRRTREGMWADSRAALADLDLPNRRRVIDVGCGTGELTRVLVQETDGEVIGFDADPGLLGIAARGDPGGPTSAAGTAADAGDEADGDPVDGGGMDADPVAGREGADAEGIHAVAGDAVRLPFVDDAADLVVCQALLINLPDPAAAVAEFARVSSGLVAAIEPDNAAVAVDSTVDREADLEARARGAYLAGVETDVALGSAEEPFRAAGLEVVSTRRYDHVQVVEAPYSRGAIDDARRKATGAGLADDRETMLAGGLTDEAYDDLRAEWRSMGRAVVDAMQRGDYRREETVPFYVTVGRV